MHTSLLPWKLWMLSNFLFWKFFVQQLPVAHGWCQVPTEALIHLTFRQPFSDTTFGAGMALTYVLVKTGSGPIPWAGGPGIVKDGVQGLAWQKSYIECGSCVYHVCMHLRACTNEILFVAKVLPCASFPIRRSSTGVEGSKLGKIKNQKHARTASDEVLM